MTLFTRWDFHRAKIDRVSWLTPFSRNPQLQRAIILGESNPIPQAQIYPFVVCEEYIRQKFKVQLRELPLRKFIAKENPYASDEVHYVLFQTWFDLGPEELIKLVNRINETWPLAKLAYLDLFAPTDLRFASTLQRHVKLYLKKQILADVSQYGKSTIGHTNLTDFFCRRYGIQAETTNFSVETDFLEKILLGPSFAQSAEILALEPGRHQTTYKPIDVHARIKTGGTNWYSKMRNEALQSARRLSANFNVACEGRVSKKQYFQELRAAKVCFSPFGYGEICWRDFEAMACGALLLKPDLTHLETDRNIFIPYETYVPLSWDLSDLAEKADYYIRSPGETARITQNATRLLKALQSKAAFEDSMDRFWIRMGT